MLDLGIEFRGGARIDRCTTLLGEGVRRGLRRQRRAARPRSRHSRTRAKPRRTSTSASTGCRRCRSATRRAIGKRVVVLGGGNTAMDCCRSSRRLGGEDVQRRRALGLRRDEGVAVGEGRRDARGHSDPQLPRAEGSSRTTDGKLTGVTFEKVAPQRDAKGRRQLRADRRARRALPVRRRARRDRPGERVPVDRARPRHRRSTSGACRSSTDDDGLDAARRVLRRRCGVRPEEHHLGGRARPRRGDLDRPATAAARTWRSVRRRTSTCCRRRWASTSGATTTRSPATAATACRSRTR